MNLTREAWSEGANETINEGQMLTLRERVIARAVEGGYFDEANEAYFDAPSETREEAAAYVELYRLAKNLLDEWPLRETIETSKSATFRWVLTAKHWREFLRRTRFPDVVPDDMLDEIDRVDETGRIGDPAWLVNANAYRARRVPAKRET